MPQQTTTPLNPGIRRLVAWLNHTHKLGTTDSGDGVTGDFECDWGRPYVVISHQHGAALKYHDALPTSSVLAKALEREARENKLELPHGWEVEVTHGARSGATFIVVTGLRDEHIWGGTPLQEVE